MDPVVARVRLERMVAAGVEPTLSPTDIDDLLNLARRVDVNGLSPSDVGWIPTFDLDAAAAEGWRTKAGRAVPRFGVSLDGDTLNRQQIYVHCLKQADAYARRILGSLRVVSDRQPASTVRP